MKVAIHQPHFLPWLGYLHRMASVDTFVILDHVQFERRNYQNRASVRMDDESRWLTVPVVQRSQKERIVEKEIDNTVPWGAKHFATLRHAYRDAGFFSTYAPSLKSIFERQWGRLSELTAVTMEFARDAFGIRTPIVRTSELGVDGAKSDLILNVCKAVGATGLVAGFGGSRGYLDVEKFAAEGVRVEWHQFTHPQYRQCGTAPFMPGLASVDLLFNCGPESRAILLGEPARHEPCAAA
ncbi:MAG TPA: WbqC family protein [Burkholderiales bacterium]|nr:WbqC family protein [Burkholderiales bacterium]